MFIKIKPIMMIIKLRKKKRKKSDNLLKINLIVLYCTHFANLMLLTFHNNIINVLSKFYFEFFINSTFY
jgi:hypothetical protein